MRIQQIDIMRLYMKKILLIVCMNQLNESGLSLPIKAIIKNGRYYCQDGHKRISAINEMISRRYLSKRRKINIIVMNNGNNRSMIVGFVKNMH